MSCLNPFPPPCPHILPILKRTRVLSLTSTFITPGLVHLHDHPPHLHPPLHRRLLLPILHPRSRLLDARHWVPPTQLREQAKPTHHQSRWLLRTPSGVRGLVQCYCGYRGRLQQVRLSRLVYPHTPLPFPLLPPFPSIYANNRKDPKLTAWSVETASSSSPSHISPGPSRARRCASRRTTVPPSRFHNPPPLNPTPNNKDHID